MKHEKNLLIWKLLNMIDAGGQSGVDAIARELEISRRSVLRYIDVIYKSGFPLYYDRVEKSYKFVNGFSLKKLDLSKEEINTLTLTGQYARLLGAPFARAFEETKSKISLDAGHKTRQGMKAPVIPFLIKAEPLEDNPAHKAFFDTFAECHSAGRAAEIVYQTMWSGQRRTREVGPYGITHYDGRLFLIGYCFFRKQIRTFSFEGLLAARPGKIFYKIPASFNLEKHLEIALGIDYGQGKTYQVKIRFVPEAVKWIQHRKWHPSQKIRPEPDGGAILSFNIAGEEEILKWLTAWANHAELLEPDWLRKKLVARLHDTLKVYE